MNTQHIHQALEAAKAATLEAGTLLREQYGRAAAESKGTMGDAAKDITTALDRDVERLLARKLHEFDATIGFHGEEFGATGSTERVWLVDAIDGTAHFIRGLPFCTTTIALVEGKQVLLAIIYDFVREDMYWAVKGEGAFCNGQRLQVSDRPLGKAFVHFESQLRDAEAQALNLALHQRSGTLIATANAGFEFAMIAAGKLDGRITKNPYGDALDYAPGCLLVAEAGGIVRNLGQNSYDYHNYDYLAVNPLMYKELTEGPGALLPVAA